MTSTFHVGVRQSRLQREIYAGCSFKRRLRRRLFRFHQRATAPPRRIRANRISPDYRRGRLVIGRPKLRPGSLAELRSCQGLIRAGGDSLHAAVLVVRAQRAGPCERVPPHARVMVVALSREAVSESGQVMWYVRACCACGTPADRTVLAITLAVVSNVASSFLPALGAPAHEAWRRIDDSQLVGTVSCRNLGVAPTNHRRQEM